jgi:glycolate oxidase FAD binding subunit
MVIGFMEKAEALGEIVGRDHVRTDPADVVKYAVDGKIPGAVVFPKDTRQVSEAIKFANRENLAVVPWGSGTKISTGSPPERLDLVLCTSRLNHMPDVDTANLTITVEAGVKFRDIQARLATEEDRCYLPLDSMDTEADEFICSERSNSGCFLPLDPPFGTRATIGGILAADSTGPRRLLYGRPRDMVLGVRFVTPGGEIVGSGGKTVKNVSGYDISKLMIGSTGSLGILCEMTLRLLPLPERMETLLMAFNSLENASAAADSIFETSYLPAAVDVISGNTAHFLPFAGSSIPRGAFLVATALESFDEAVDRMKSGVIEIAKTAGCRETVDLLDEDHQRFWLALGNLRGTAGDRAPGSVAVKLNFQLSDWKNILRYADEILASSGISHTLQCHAGSGICLIHMFLTGDQESASEKAVSAVGTLLDRAVEANGNLMVQDAPPELKPKLPIWGAPRTDFPVLTRIKNRLDPSGIMSPGRFVGQL